MKTRTLTNKRWLPMAIVPLFSVAILAGCSSDDDDSTGGGTTVVADANEDGTPDAFQVLDPFNADATLVDANGDSVDDRDVDMDGIDDRDANENGIADQYETPADSTATAADENGNFIDDSFEVAEVGGADDADGDGVNDAAAALLAGGGATTSGETTGSTTSGETGGETTGGETSGETTGGTTSGETTGGTTGGETTGGTTGTVPTGSIDGITFGSSTATADLTFDGSRITGSVTAQDAVEVALYSGIAASDGNVQRVLGLNGSAPTFFMPNPLSDQENAPVIDNFQSGNLYVQVTTNTGEVIRSDQLLPPGGTVTPVFVPLEVATDSDFNSNGAGFLHVNTVTGQYAAVVTVNIDVSDLDADGNTISVASAHIHSGSAAGDILVPLTMDTSTAFSATGTFDAADLATIQQNNGWFNVHLNDGTTPGASLVTGQIVFTQ